MTGTCPHCGAPLPERPDAYCPECRTELPTSSPAVTPPTEVAAGPPPPVDPEAARVAAFWRTLIELTPRVYVVQVLIAFNVAVFVLMVASGVSAANPTVPQLLAWGADFGPSTLNGEWWRILSCTFVHIGIVHIALNMWVLATVGPLVARMLGNSGFLVLYLIAGLGGSLASLMWQPNIVSAGASGAVFGVYGGLLGILQRQRGAVPPAALTGLRSSGLSFLAYNLIFGLAQPNIDMAAHLGGLAVGYFCGLVLSGPFTPDGAAGRPARNVLAGVLGIVFVVVGAVSVSVRHGGTADAQAELERFVTTEEKALGAFNSAVKQAGRGEMTKEGMAEVLERDVLPEWRAAHARLAALNGLPPDVQRRVNAVIEYVRLRQEGWEFFVQSVREGDDSKAARAEEKHRLADEAVNRLNADAKGR